MELRAGNNGPIAAWVTLVNVDVGAVGAAAVLEVSTTVPGVEAGDAVYVSCPDALTANLLIGSGRGSAANTVQWRVVNPTAAPIDPAALNYNFFVVKVANLRRAA